MLIEKEDSESTALEFIQQSLGTISWEWTGEDSSQSDGYITLPSGKEIQIEVSGDLPAALMRAAAILDRNGSVFPLSEGYGSWRVLVSPSDAFPNFPNMIGALIDDYYVSHRAVHDGAVFGADYEFKGFNIVILQKMAQEPDEIAIAASTLDTSRSTFIDTSPNAIASYAQLHIDSQLERAIERGRDSKFQKLITRSIENGRKSHYALVVSNPDDTGVRFAMNGIGAHSETEIPDVGLNLPDGLDSFWMIRGDFEWGAEFSAEHGWKTYGYRLGWRQQGASSFCFIRGVNDACQISRSLKDLLNMKFNQG